MEYYLLTIRGYYGEDLYFEEKHRLKTYRDAVAMSADILMKENPNNRYVRYDVRIELIDEH